jgi:pimeloyl-ACP methyl ester carboxylesterase
MVAFVLVHSPLVGPLTWSLVEAEMRGRGIMALAPALPDSRGLDPPYWRHHAEAIARAMEAVPGDEAIVLVGHSGGGMLLPAVREVINRPVSAYIFVDAGIPRDGMSRLDFFGESEAWQFKASAKNGLLPNWSNEDLIEAIPNPDRRRRFVRELVSLPLAVYEEPIPVFAGWPDAPCGYLQFTSAYQQPADEARQADWGYCKLEGGHFLMLNDPASVADALIDLTNEML